MIIRVYDMKVAFDDRTPYAGDGRSPGELTTAEQAAEEQRPRILAEFELPGKTLVGWLYREKRGEVRGRGRGRGWRP